MRLGRRTLLGAGIAATMPLGAARAQADNTVRVGVLTDLSGVYRDVGGPTSVACARQAADEFTAANPDIKVEVVAADHQNKPDIGLGIAREWFDRGGVDIVTDINNSALAIGLRTLAEERDKVELVTSAGTSDLTGKIAVPTCCTGAGTLGVSRIPREAPWCGRVATNGISSPPTMPLATLWRMTRLSL